MRSARGRRVLLISSLLLVVTLILAGGVGSVRIPPGEVVGILLSHLPGVDLTAAWPQSHDAIIWRIRAPRVVLGALTGIALSVAGGAYQGLFKNPLADPYVLGVSSGAALGGAVAMAFLGTVTVRLIGTVPAFAFLGGVAAVSLVYRLALVGRRVPVVTLLLAGVAVGALCSSLVSLILFITDSQARDAIIFWMMGSLAGATWTKVGWVVPYLLVGLGMLLFCARELNALLMGEDAARHLGVDVERVKRVILVGGSLLTATAVAFSGTIGFIGLIVPHITRLLVGPDHRYLLPASGLIGAIVLVAADTIARSLLGTQEIPVGLVMSAIGGPFFLWLLRQRLKQSEG